MKIQAYVCPGAGLPLEAFEYSAEPAPGEVLVKVTHCGICHSDVHLADGDWGEVYPLVPGHEVIGEVVEGEGFERGARVGIGWQRGSCGTCEWCRQGKEVVCAQHQATCMGHYGGFASHVIAGRDFVFPIPDALESETAAPLLCGGATVFTPLKLYGHPNSRVAVIGIGGLGHMALQFASHACQEVTAVSTKPDKEHEARDFGATHFLVGEPKPRSYDLVLNTATVGVDMQAWTEALRPEGVFVQLGAAPAPLEVPGMNLITGYRSVTGSAVAHPAVLSEMLLFAARCGVRARVEVMPMQECNQAMARTRKGSARYRVVLRR